MKTIAFLALVLAVWLSTAAFAGEPTVVRVEPKYVCMINDTLFQREQIAVDVSGKTYFGCCAMCKERLANRPEARVALDPVSGKEVDKASAVIGARPDGSVVYFESQESLDRYAAANVAPAKDGLRAH